MLKVLFYKKNNVTNKNHIVRLQNLYTNRFLFKFSLILNKIIQLKIHLKKALKIY